VAGGRWLQVTAGFMGYREGTMRAYEILDPVRVHREPEHLR